jgi:uncharacterized protein
MAQWTGKRLRGSSQAWSVCDGAVGLMVSLRVIVTGPPSSGKTAFIRAVSEISVLSTERPLSATSARGETSVSMDFGRITVGDGLVLYLFGTPIQDSPGPWEALADGLMGFVVLADGANRSSMVEAARAVALLADSPGMPFVVGLTHVEPRDRKAESEGRTTLAVPPAVPVLGLDARDRAHVREVLLALMAEVLRTIG